MSSASRRSDDDLYAEDWTDTWLVARLVVAMTARQKLWTDRIWMVWFCIQPFIILLADAVSLYPARLTGPGAPLHVLQRLQDWYVATYQDPIVAWRPATSAANGCHDSWIGAALHVELLFSLPVALLGVYRFAVAPRRGTSGPEELLLLVYAFETAFTTGLCMYDVFFWDPAVYSTAMKKTFLYQFYAPWLVLPSLLFVDMARRMLTRFRFADAVMTDKKIR
ncbi:hypothetical protein P8C59_000822 [Phyllachora maydis]|uniref:EXPERA domain-containing protein n=1 Tax=Phyllachora maydis TaxID=1825666 RepID=A0AAD9HWX8_9PEZI|nr:hypothetical protein P8C59_000822 [Phyllachora maydis]